MSAAMFGVHVLACRLLAQWSELCILAWWVRIVEFYEKTQLAGPGTSVYTVDVCPVSSCWAVRMYMQGCNLSVFLVLLLSAATGIFLTKGTFRNAAPVITACTALWLHTALQLVWWRWMMLCSQPDWTIYTRADDKSLICYAALSCHLSDCQALRQCLSYMQILSWLMQPVYDFFYSAEYRKQNTFRSDLDIP